MSSAFNSLQRAAREVTSTATIVCSTISGVKRTVHISKYADIVLVCTSYFQYIRAYNRQGKVCRSNTVCCNSSIRVYSPSVQVSSYKFDL